MKKHIKKAIEKFGTPLYLYDADVIRRQCRALRTALPEAEFHYACKANSNPALLSIIRSHGIGVEAVSPGELHAARTAGYRKEHISFTCSNLTEDELRFAGERAGRVHLDSLRQIELWGKAKLGRRISIRVNQGIGSGHHAHVVTGGPESKFGVTLSDLPRAISLAERYGLTITSLHQHIGSNVLDAGVLSAAVEKLFETARKIPTVTHLDFGGGFGVPYRPQEKPIDLRRFATSFRMLVRSFEDKTGRSMTYSFEPGRYVVAESGTLLAEVVDVKKTSKNMFAGINASAIGNLLRAVLYDAYHEIENVSRPNAVKKAVTVAGNVCESGDVFARRRRIPLPRVGDILAVRNAGAYVRSMASHYNLRSIPREVLVTKTGSRVI